MNRPTSPPGQRPVFLNLFRISFPVTAILSIMHRLMGVAMVLALPLVIYIFGLSLSGEQGWQTSLSILAHPLSKLFIFLLLWSLIHHLLAGIRFLLIDIEWGVSKSAARASAWFINIAAIIVTLILAWRLL